MIHKIKRLYDQGRGLSVRAISRELGISRNTVRKYLKMNEADISRAREDSSRTRLPIVACLGGQVLLSP